ILGLTWNSMALKCGHSRRNTCETRLPASSNLTSRPIARRCRSHCATMAWACFIVSLSWRIIPDLSALVWRRQNNRWKNSRAAFAEIGWVIFARNESLFMKVPPPGETNSDSEFSCSMHLNELPEPLISLALKCVEDGGIPFNRYLRDSDLALRRRIAAHYGLTEENVMLEAGADGGLRLCFQWCCHQSQTVWIPDPSYTGFRQIMKAVGCRSREYRVVDAEL